MGTTRELVSDQTAESRTLPGMVVMITKTTNPYISCLSIDPELGGVAVLQPLNAVAQHETGCFCLTSINCAELIPQPLKRVPRNPLEVAQTGKPDETDDESAIC